jgi:acyl-CoA synthetase (AMP-forming)/AMP-acid ligase II/1-acyl-sn-glycerol-3-phosphate acyltransferase/acyl carrier protein
MLYLLLLLVAVTIPLRYRIRVRGLDECVKKGRRGVLFLPNHPALIDPVIVNLVLFWKFRPRSLVDIKQIRFGVLKYLERTLNMLPLPDIGISGRSGRDEVLKQLEACTDALNAGDNLLLYPAGRIYRSRYEKLRGNGAVARILDAQPEQRIVLVRTRGLWGSSFGRAKGYQNSFAEVLTSHIKHLLLNGIFFGPRREVTLDFVELPEDFPRQGDKDEMNRYLEKFYNEDAPPNTYVPYLWWERGGARVIPEPDAINVPVDTRSVPEEVRRKVYERLHEVTSKKFLKETDTLGTDLGLDSLLVAELQGWLQEEFGFQVNNPETLRTVGSLLLAAIGESDGIEPLRPIPPEWFIKEDPALLLCPRGERISEVFLRNAAEAPKAVLLADQSKGVFTNRKIILAIMALRPSIMAIPGDRVGILMPACAMANIVYLTALFAGKIPVLVNWTVGMRNMRYCLDNAGVAAIISSTQVIERLEGRGTDFSGVKEHFHYLEDMAKGIHLLHKLRCVLASHFCWRSLRRATVPETAAVLFTSGSESRPKAVPLTHGNILSDLTASMAPMGLRRDDCVLGMLPPFHSFGLLMNFIMPACAGLRVAYHSNPTEGDMLARLIAAYRATMLVGTPTFIANILRRASKEQVRTMRLIITGAEKCPEPARDLFQEKCPAALYLEGYGITECSPVVALNQPGAAKVGSIGKIVPCLDWRVLDKEMQAVPANDTGMLYVSGASVFGGYWHYDGPSPFVEFEGKSWYRTGDLVSADEEGYITFKGRLKRFVKIGGEMVSLPAVEEVLLEKYRSEELPLPLAVEAFGSEEQPLITLFTVLPIDREHANGTLREAGLSPIHNIRQVIALSAIPVLGSGKTDYQTLKKLHAESGSSP